MFLFWFLILFVFHVPTVPEEHYEKSTLFPCWLSIDEDFTTTDLYWLSISEQKALPTGKNTVTTLV